MEVSDRTLCVWQVWQSSVPLEFAEMVAVQTDQTAECAAVVAVPTDQTAATLAKTIGMASTISKLNEHRQLSCRLQR